MSLPGVDYQDKSDNIFEKSPIAVSLKNNGQERDLKMNKEILK